MYSTLNVPYFSRGLSECLYINSHIYGQQREDLRLVQDVYSVCYVMLLLDWGTNEIEFALRARIPEPSMARRFAVGGENQRHGKEENGLSVVFSLFFSQ